MEGSLTDVAGVLVGHHQRRGRGWQTGTTVVLVPDGAVAGVDVRGGGPGTRETEALDPRNLVEQIHAVCLTGGSAYGLAAADGVMAHLERRRLGVPVGPEAQHVVPVVPAAVIFDLGRGGRFANRPTAEFGERAAKAARRKGVARGTVGAGTGARAGGLQGGVGMASITLELTDEASADQPDRPEPVVVTIAALAVVNAAGSTVDPRTGLPWEPPPWLRRPSSGERRAVAAIGVPDARLDAARHERGRQAYEPLNTTIGVVATDLVLSRAECSRLAMSAHDGLARTIRPAHLLVDGDTVFGLSTSAVDPELSGTTGAPRLGAVNQVFGAAADVFAAACTDAIVSATSLGEAPAYRDVCPSAYRTRNSPTSGR